MINQRVKLLPKHSLRANRNLESTGQREITSKAIGNDSTYYGTAYDLSYEGGFYYGDLRQEKGYLPECMRDDI